jgi:hypothetical protein
MVCCLACDLQWSLCILCAFPCFRLFVVCSQSQATPCICRQHAAAVLPRWSQLFCPTFSPSSCTPKAAGNRGMLHLHHRRMHTTGQGFSHHNCHLNRQQLGELFVPSLYLWQIHTGVQKERGNAPSTKFLLVLCLLGFWYAFSMAEVGGQRSS